jgi:hypothetical protein
MRATAHEAMAARWANCSCSLTLSRCHQRESCPREIVYIRTTHGVSEGIARPLYLKATFQKVQQLSYAPFDQRQLWLECLILEADARRGS